MAVAKLNADSTDSRKEFQHQRPIFQFQDSFHLQLSASSSATLPSYEQINDEVLKTLF